MKPGVKIAVGLLALTGLGGGIVAANLQGRPARHASAAVWIGPALDSDRAVNALPDAQAVTPARSVDPAKAQMARAPADADPVSILPPTALAPSVAKAQPSTAAAPSAIVLTPAVLPPPVTPDLFTPAAASGEKEVLTAQIALPMPSPSLVAPPLPKLPSPPAQTQAQSKPPLDTSPAPSAPAKTAQPAPASATPPANPANTLSGGAVFTGTSGRDLQIEINRGALVRLRAAADTVFVANPDIADIQVKSSRMIYIYGKKAGETVLYAVDGEDNVLLNTRVKVTHNLADFRTAIRTAAPDAGLDVSTVGDALVITGDVHSAVQAENVRRIAARFAPGDGAVVNQMRLVAPNQINLRVRVAEISRETLKEIGINWDAIFRSGGFIFGLATGNPVLSAGSFLTRNNGTNSLFGGFTGGKFDINGVIDALANQNLITVLAEPNLTAMSGETANFLAGGEFPIPVAQSGANAGSISVEFKKFGVGLAFTPTVLDDGRINLKVRPEVSQLSTVGQVLVGGFSIPALTTRRAETTVELASGQSFAIAGLLQNNSTQDANKVPFLGDVPILGALFKSDRYRRNETELVIVVTPYLVRPVSANVVAAPTDGYVPPTDGQRILFGSQNQQRVPEGARVTRGPDGNALIGPAGFQLD